MCPYPRFFWPAFSHIRTGYGCLLCKYPHSVRARENTDQKNSDYGHFPRSVKLRKTLVILELQVLSAPSLDQFLTRHLILLPTDGAFFTKTDNFMMLKES